MRLVLFLKTRQVPRFTLANPDVMRTVPAELNDLSPVREIIVALCRARLYRWNPRRSQRWGKNESSIQAHMALLCKGPQFYVDRASGSRVCVCVYLLYTHRRYRQRSPALQTTTGIRHDGLSSTQQNVIKTSSEVPQRWARKETEIKKKRGRGRPRKAGKGMARVYDA